MYHWKIHYGNLSAEGANPTLHAAIDQMIYYARGNQVRDFYVNGRHMNEEFGLWIDGGKIIHDDRTEFVPMNQWYDLLALPAPAEAAAPPVMDGIFSGLTQANTDFQRIFRPQSTRGSAPSNPATLVAGGKL